MRDFDQQAISYDRRAGLPQSARHAVALELLRMASLGPTDLLIEIGAGTGQIGRALCAMPVRYLGIDVSRRMLARFTEWCRDADLAAPIAVADASRTWPVGDGSATAIFGSRSLHLLPVPHVVQEAIRVTTRGGSYLIVGCVERDPDGFRACLRHELHAVLIRRGYTPCDAHQHGRELLGAFASLGAVAIRPRVAAAWIVRRSAREMLAAWQAVPGLAGVDVPRSEKDDVLSELAVWSKRLLGSLDSVETNEERYVLAGVQLPARSIATASA